MSNRRDELENIITEKLGAFLEVGSALLEIRRDKLFLPEYKTFGAYIRERWHFSRQRGYQFVAAARFVQQMSTGIDTNALPESEYQLRKLEKALAGIPEDTAVKVVQIAAHVAQELSPSGRIETPMIKALEDVLQTITRTSAIDDTDGGQIALSEAFEAHLTDEIRERMARNRQYISDALTRKHGASEKIYEQVFSGDAFLHRAIWGGMLNQEEIDYEAEYKIVVYKTKKEVEPA